MFRFVSWHVVSYDPQFVYRSIQMTIIVNASTLIASCLTANFILVLRRMHVFYTIYRPIGVMDSVNRLTRCSVSNMCQMRRPSLFPIIVFYASHSHPASLVYVQSSYSIAPPPSCTILTQFLLYTCYIYIWPCCPQGRRLIRNSPIYSSIATPSARGAHVNTTGGSFILSKGPRT